MDEKDGKKRKIDLLTPLAFRGLSEEEKEALRRKNFRNNFVMPVVAAIVIVIIWIILTGIFEQSQ